MRGNKLIRLLRQCALPFLALLVLAGFFLTARGRVQTQFPVLEPQNGVLDARGVDFTDGVYHIVNRWEYRPGQILSPEEFSSYHAPENGEAPIDSRLGTWRLVLLAKPGTYLSLCGFSIDYGTRVFVDGREVRNIGFVSADPAEAAPMLRYMTLPLYTGDDGRLEIVYQYSNFIHNDGGFIQNTLISTPENIDEYQRGLTLWSLLLSCGLIFFALYFLLGAAIRKNREYAALALCCAVIAFRDHLFFGEYLLGPGYDFVLHYRLIVLDASLIPFSALILFAAFFPQVCGKKSRSVIVLVSLYATLLLCHFIVGTKQLVPLCVVCCMCCVPFLILFVYRFIRHFRRERMTSLDALTIAAVAVLIGTLVYEGLNVSSDSVMNHFGISQAAMVICIMILSVVINSRVRRQAAALEKTRLQNELLGRTNEMNRDFLRTVAHELKTPLTVISGYAQLMGRQLDKGALAENAPQRLDTIRQEADRLAEIVTRLMDYTYGADREAELASVDVRELFGSAGAVLRPVCDKRGNKLSFSDAGGVTVHGNSELLLQVLINLVVNANRHTESGEISVETEDAGAYVAFRVRDTGTGIAPEIVPHIFEKGFTTTEGKGLGLAICSESVALHGGTLELEYTGPQGSCFRFTVPKEGEK